MAGGCPIVPVYDLKIKDSDLVAATHGRSFWILDDVTPLRGLADGRKGTRLFAPRTAIRTKLHWSAGANVRTGVGLRSRLRHRRQHGDGRTGRRHALCASISMSARTRPTAPSSTTGWRRRTTDR